MNTSCRLIVVYGPTAVGKTAYAVRLAQALGTEILSFDSRQFYSELRIGVARPSDDELAAVRHHFVACRSVSEPYNIYSYRNDALLLLDQLFRTHDTVVTVGGSGLYADALLRPVSPLPDPTPELRADLQRMPLPDKRSLLRRLDPEYYARVDLRNPVRLQRALEVCLMTGRPYSQVVAEGNQVQEETPGWQTEVRMLTMDRDRLRSRIDGRVGAMMQEGLLDEVHSLLPMRHLPTLNTVGYRELFPVFDGNDTVEHAVEQIKLNTWHYARKQMTWMRRYQKLPNVSEISL